MLTSAKWISYEFAWYKRIGASDGYGNYAAMGLKLGFVLDLGQDTQLHDGKLCIK